MILSLLLFFWASFLTLPLSLLPILSPVLNKPGTSYTRHPPLSLPLERRGTSFSFPFSSPPPPPHLTSLFLLLSLSLLTFITLTSDLSLSLSLSYSYSVNLSLSLPSSTPQGAGHLPHPGPSSVEGPADGEPGGLRQEGGGRHVRLGKQQSESSLWFSHSLSFQNKLYWLIKIWKYIAIAKNSCCLLPNWPFGDY